MTDSEDLARVLHEAACSDSDRGGKCLRWVAKPMHRKYYADRAEAIMTALEPVIGAENVPVACRVILEEMG
jgi:hypothetical protein